MNDPRTDISEDFRQPARIARVEVGPEDHGMHTAWLFLEWDGGGQGFGGIVLDGGALTRDYLADLCARFGVSDVEALVGRKCYALRCFRGGSIEGVESETGGRFTLTDWRRKHWPERATTPLDDRREVLHRSIESAAERIKQASRDLVNLGSEYHAWSKWETGK